MHSANVNPYGTVTLAQLAQMTPEELDEMCKQYDTQTLMTTLRASRDPKMVWSYSLLCSGFKLFLFFCFVYRFNQQQRKQMIDYKEVM